MSKPTPVKDTDSDAGLIAAVNEYNHLEASSQRVLGEILKALATRRGSRILVGERGNVAVLSNQAATLEYLPVHVLCSRELTIESLGVLI